MRAKERGWAKSVKLFTIGAMSCSADSGRQTDERDVLLEG